MVTKAAALPDTGYWHKSEFAIDLEAGIVTCPGDQQAHFRFRRGHSTEAVFAAATCAACPFQGICVQTPGQGRTITINAYEDQLQAACRRREEPDFAELMPHAADGGTQAVALESAWWPPLALLRPSQDPLASTLERGCGRHRALDGDRRRPGRGISGAPA